jgi:predicted acetyltransferase
MSNRDPFFDPGPLIDAELELVLVAANPADPARGWVAEYIFEMRLTGTTTRVGEIRLRLALTPRLAEFGGHVGYGVEEPFRGHHYAARACKLLFPLARRHGLDPLLITCDPENIPSRRTIERIGGRLRDIINVEIEPGKWRLTCRYDAPLAEKP